MTSAYKPVSYLAVAAAAFGLFKPQPAWSSSLAVAGAFAATLGEDDPGEPLPLTVVTDLNRDGIPDVVEARRPASAGAGERGLLIVSLGSGDGSFAASAAAPVLGSDPRAIVAGDFNGDGIPDVVVGDGSGVLSEFLGDGKGGLVPAGEIGHFASVVSVAAADFNHDGMFDLAVSDSHTGTVAILLGSGGGSFRRAWTFRLPMPGTVYTLAAADFNGDGLPDLAVTNEEGDAYEVMLGNGNGTFTSSPELSHLKDPNAHCVT